MSGSVGSAGNPVAMRATYRLQLRRGLGFAEAEAIVPYLAELGVSHVYCSPYVEARAGSEHGYDVVDPRRLDPSLGSERDFESFVSTLRRHGMGQILDWVPNHVGIALGENAWWQDVLAFGRASSFAGFFDIDWTPNRRELRGKVLLPVLGGSYGEVLERGEIVPVLAPDGGLTIAYFDHRFPASPASWGRLLARRLDEGEIGPSSGELAQVLADLAGRGRPRRDRVERAREAQRRLGRALEDSASLRRGVERVVGELAGEPGRPASFGALHRLLEAQHYRLAYWRVAAEEINYRRFFDINELAAVRMERAEVFDHAHASVFSWIEAGKIDGLRIDHVDGLADPEEYCARIRARFPEHRLYLVVEKILGVDEALLDSWPVDGTTGYEFGCLANGLFVDPGGRKPLERFYRAFTGETPDFDTVLSASKRRVLRTLLASELDGLATALDRLAQGDRRTRDFTLRGLRDALAEIVEAFPVYRSYVGARGTTEEDEMRIAHAVERARRRSEDPGSGLFEWILRVLNGDLARESRGARRHEVLHFIRRFQQYTAPVMAKGFEDTGLYRHAVLLSLNEVGGDPRRFAVDPASFHDENRRRAERHPRAMLATSTHDTKRGEDVRARIDVLSELATVWGRKVREWSRLNRPHRRLVDGEPAPVAKDEYFLYQTLVGSFPTEPMGPAELAGYRDRVQAYMIKALREAKERSSWRHPRHAYEDAVTRFVEALLAPDARFLAEFLPFHDDVAVRGAQNGLSQLALKLAAPGVPDVYQGCEGWDLSLADPDNRRPIDFSRSRTELESLRSLPTSGGAIEPAAIADVCLHWRDGRIKRWLTWRLLDCRRRRPDLFVGAGYEPLSFSGAHADRLVGFARTRGADALLVVVPRLCASLARSESGFSLGAEAWGGTVVHVPASLGAVSWHDELTGGRLDRSAGAPAELDVALLLRAFPVAVLCSTGTGERGS